MEIMDYTQYIIIALCLAFGKWLKGGTRINNNLIPVACGFFGWLLATVGHNCLPSFPTSDTIDALGLGILSGLSAIGVHQFGKAAIPAVLKAITEVKEGGKDA